MNLPDIYFEPVWGKLYADKDKGEHRVFIYENESGTVYYSFLKRKINVKIDKNTYYDIISPYGFGGPIILDCKKNKGNELLLRFKTEFDSYCNANKIITDSCRFSPWLKNNEDFGHMYEIVPNFSTVGIKLSVEDIFMDELKSKKRNMIRKAIKNNIKIHFDHVGNSIDNFIQIYEQTITKNNISDYYRFTKDFFQRNFESLKNKIFIAHASYNNKIISIAIFLISNDYIHYHLSANDSEYRHLAANDLLLYEVALYGKQLGKKYLMLGGAGNNNALHKHKMGFTNNSEFAFFKGKRICDNEVYNAILKNCEKVDPNFFPSYR